MSEGNGSYLYVKNWSKFQHYKHRSPRWIKLHRDILQDYNFRKLTDSQRLGLVLIWVLAANHDGLIPNDPNYLRVMLGLKHSPDLKTLINQGWLSENASDMLAQSRVEKSRVEKKGQKPVDKSRIEERLPDYLYKRPVIDA